MALTFATATRNASAESIGALLDGGKLILYTGSRPASANTAITDQTKLAEVPFNNPAFGSASNGTVTATAISNVTPIADGEATWARLVDSGGSTVMDASVSESGGGGDVILGDTQISTGVDLVVVSITLTQPSGE